MEEHVAELANEAQAAWKRAHHRPTFREFAGEWLVRLEEVKGAKPTTIADYSFLLREPGTPYKRGKRVSAGRWEAGALR